MSDTKLSPALTEIVEKIEKVHVPVLVLHGDRDEVVPYEQGKRVFEAAREPKEFYTIRGAHHNDTFLAGGENYFAALRSFIERVTARPPAS